MPRGHVSLCGIKWVKSCVKRFKLNNYEDGAYYCTYSKIKMKNSNYEIGGGKWKRILKILGL